MFPGKHFFGALPNFDGLCPAYRPKTAVKNEYFFEYANAPGPEPGGADQPACPGGGAGGDGQAGHCRPVWSMAVSPSSRSWETGTRS